MERLVILKSQALLELWSLNSAFPGPLEETHFNSCLLSTAPGDCVSNDVCNCKDTHPPRQAAGDLDGYVSQINNGGKMKCINTVST